MVRRSPPTPPSRPSAVAAALAGLFAMAAMAPMAAIAGDDGSTRSPASARLARDGAGWRVEVGGSSTPLELAPGSRVEAVVGRGAGWLAVGTRPAGDGRRELWLVESAGGGAGRSGASGPTSRELVAPHGQVGRVRERPVAVVAGDALLGLAWLEGDERRAYTVRWAGWSDGGFAEPVVVSPRGPGSQLALDAARLDDGRTVLVWSGYDGTDDEIWSSVDRPGGGDWSKPARVGADDRVPDVAPTLIAVPGGALVAWSRFDADAHEYRLAFARWSGEGFDAPRPLGTPGALAPRFERGGVSPWLSWRDARADLWSLGQIGPDGGLVVRSTAAGTAGERPAVDWSEGEPPVGGFAPRERSTPPTPPNR